MVRFIDRLGWDSMIGQFCFSDAPSQDDVVLQIGWDDATPVGRVLAPGWVVAFLKRHDVTVRGEDEYMSLAIALSYSVLVSAMSGAKLTLSGDCSAWPELWGMLKKAGQHHLETVRSH